MANKVTFDYSLTENVISADEIKSMEKITNDAKELLLSKEGAGSDFLGWIDLPIDYDKEEFARIQKAAEKIQSDSEVNGIDPGSGNHGAPFRHLIWEQEQQLSS